MNGKWKIAGKENRKTTSAVSAIETGGRCGHMHPPHPSSMRNIASTAPLLCSMTSPKRNGRRAG